MFSVFYRSSKRKEKHLLNVWRSLFYCSEGSLWKVSSVLTTALISISRKTVGLPIFHIPKFPHSIWNGQKIHPVRKCACSELESDWTIWEPRRASSFLRWLVMWKWRTENLEVSAANAHPNRFFWFIHFKSVVRKKKPTWQTVKISPIQRLHRCRAATYRRFKTDEKLAKIRIYSSRIMSNFIITYRVWNESADTPVQVKTECSYGCQKCGLQ